MALFRSFWHKGALTPYEQLCLKSFIDNGHQFTLYSYDKIDVPRGVRLEDARTILPEEEVFFYRSGDGAGSVSAFSNLFRYSLLDAYGEWWSDTDVLCLSEEVPSGEICFAHEDALRINGALIKAPAQHPFVQTLQSEARALGKDVSWGQCGPELVTRVVRQLSLEKFLVPTNLLYPVHYTRALDVLVPSRKDEIAAAIAGSAFHHLWNEMFRRAPILKHVAPPPDSYLSDKFLEHGIEFMSGLQYSDYQIQRIAESANYPRMLDERDQQIARLTQTLAEQGQELTELRRRSLAGA
jgi:hypothetical protein